MACMTTNLCAVIDGSDRLELGLKGAMSEARLDASRRLAIVDPVVAHGATGCVYGIASSV